MRSDFPQLCRWCGCIHLCDLVARLLASGLLWLSELIEEHSRLAKVVGERGIYLVIALHCLLYATDSLPLKHTAFSIACQIIYLQNFTPSWPMISLSSLSFMLSCVAVIVNHFVWFFYFSRITSEARHAARRPYGNPRFIPRVPNFGDIATFFGFCVWFIPVFLFLSLSANDNALPTNSGHSSVPSTPTVSNKALTPISTRPRGSLFRSLYDTMPRVRPRPIRRDTSEGLIAPRSPNLTPRPVSPSPASQLQRMPSMSSLPPPLHSPRRVASESDAPDTYVSTDEIERPTIRIAPLRLGTPPRRSANSGRP
ncbi:DUF396-domain-containing protein [Daedalea quercina L-15889]|uniref:DUF396-domain-containing protein n=1 Tax=Daedalea quercina L-15889 TaxID=1314783 RepID=A0A165SVW9_9APHY|nr:DUF396-domain-containing protein [Daedalea quercina L-15889]